MLIRRHGLDINKISASGKNGRVLKEDVLAYIESGQANKDKTKTKAKAAATATPIPSKIIEGAGSFAYRIAPLTGVKDTDV